MNLSKKLRQTLLGFGLFVCGIAWAQDDATSPFEDFPDFDVQEDAPNVDQAMNEAVSGSAAKNANNTTNAKNTNAKAKDTNAKAKKKNQSTSTPSSSDNLSEKSEKNLSKKKQEGSAVTKKTDEEETAQALAEALTQEEISEESSPKNNVMTMGASSQNTEDLNFEELAASDSVPDQLIVKTPETPSPSLSQPTNTEDFGDPAESLFGSEETEYPDDVRALKQRLEEAESVYGDRRREEGLGEPGDELSPPEQFSRVPLRPPMSDANWLRWAGPMSTKEYKIRRGDSLWAVSERLFGNPYLWPKIWHLNARITNPHIIEKGMVLSFNPGNPGSAPELAFKPDPTDPNDIAFHPLTKLDKKKTLLEIVDEKLRQQISAPHPPFQHFLLDTRPKTLAEIPSVPNRSGRVFWSEGDSFRTKLADGVFPIVKIRAATEKFLTVYKTRWLGLLEVKSGKATIIQAFAEINAGDEVIMRKFQLSPLAIHNDSVGPEYRDGTTLVSLQEGVIVSGGAGQLFGVRFPAIGLGPRPGALLEIQVGHNRKARALLVDRDQRVGTLWILDGQQEVSVTDKIY
jgi:nucleoid-associated protein YgaU